MTPSRAQPLKPAPIELSKTERLYGDEDDLGSDADEEEGEASATEESTKALSEVDYLSTISEREEED